MKKIRKHLFFNRSFDGFKSLNSSNPCHNMLKIRDFMKKIRKFLFFNRSFDGENLQILQILIIINEY